MFLRRYSLSNPTVFDKTAASVLDKLIDEFVHSERDRAMMKRHLIDGVKFEPLSEEFDLSVRHTKTIVKARKDFLEGFLIKEGDTNA